MNKTPPKMMEWIVARMVPPARREEVLGDLQERCQGPAQYLLDALRTVPHVIASQMRRSTDPRLVICEALALYLAFLTAPAHPGARSLIFDPAMLAPALIPVAASLVALRFIDTYSLTGARTRTVIMAQVALAVAITCAAEQILWIEERAMALPRGALLQGGILACFLLWMLRMAMPADKSRLQMAGPGHTEQTPDEDIQQQAKKFRERIRDRNRTEYAGAALVIAYFGIRLFETGQLAARIGFALIIAGSIYAMYHLRTKESPGAPPAEGTYEKYAAYHRRELVRQRDLLHSIWRWYLGPFLPGGVVLIAGSVLSAAARQKQRHPSSVFVGAAIFGLILLLIWKGNQRAERRLQLEIDDLDAETSRR